MKFRQFCMIGLSALMFVACSSAPPKADIAADASPQEEINKFVTDMDAAVQNHADLLAAEDLTSARKWLKEAQDDLADRKNQSEVIDDIRKGRGFLNRAMTTVEQRRARVQGILDARAAAAAAGVKNFSKLHEQFISYDDDLRDRAKDVGAQKLNSDDFARMQTNYLNLELAAIQETQLGAARAAIEGALEGGARTRAPQALKKAETDFANALNTIAANRREPNGFAPAVAQSKASAEFLKNVVATLRAHSKMGEPAAAEMVRKNMQIASLKSDLNQAATETENVQKRLDSKDQQLSSQGQALSRAQHVISIQQAIESARKEFNESEAEVFQQGDKLVVRLKAMQFPSGRSELPPESLALLAKVKNVATSLNPSEVVVEGHTDSTGTQKKNIELSQERARTVATYLEKNGLESVKINSVGYGFERPLGTNKSAAGRAQNRRVDVIITPNETASETTVQ